MDYPSFSFSPQGSVEFEGYAIMGRSVLIVGRGWEFGVGRMEGDSV